MSVAEHAPSDNRSAHRDRTRGAIVQAFLEILVDENPATVSMPAVARRAGVSIRTLYRYVPNKDALVEAASTHLHADLLDELGGEPTTSDLPGYLGRLWPKLAANIPGIWVQQTNATGREIRRLRLERRRTVLTEELRDRVSDVRLAETVDSIIAITSSSMMVELVDRMGHTPGRAAELAARLVQLVLDDAAGPPPSVSPPPSDHHGGSP